MKKYIKPELFFERFELSQQIAACDYDLVEGSFSDAACAFSGEEFGEEIVIFLSEAICDVSPESYCQHNSSSGEFGIFNS